MRGPRTNLDQWHCFMAVVDEGSYSKAAEKLHKSQSAVTYAIQKLEEQLAVALFEIKGRKADDSWFEIYVDAHTGEIVK